MKLNRLYVQLFAPTSSGKGKIGTAFPVAKNVLLTAAHVIFDLKTGKPHCDLKEVQARWWDQENSLPQQCQKILWRSIEDDVVLIQCESPPDYDGFGRIRFWSPRPHTKFNSQGFARVEKREDARCILAFSGETEEIATGTRQFDLKLTGGEPSEQEHWKGASGCPVFVDDQIVGVIVEAPSNYGARRLRCTPLFLFQDDAEFQRHAVNHEEKLNSNVQVLKNQAIACLRNSPETLDALVAHMDTLENQEDQVIGCIDELLRFPERVLELCVTAQNNANSVNVEQTMQVLIWKLLPIVFRPNAKEAIEIRKIMEAGGSSVVSLPYSKHNAIIEFYMASADGREIRLKYDGSKWKTKEEMFVESPDSGPEQWNCARFLRHAYEKLSIGRGDPDDLGKDLIRDKLIREKKHQRYHHYFIYDEGLFPEEEIKKISSELDNLIFFVSKKELDRKNPNDGRLIREEHAIFDFLITFLGSTEKP